MGSPAGLLHKRWLLILLAILILALIIETVIIAVGLSNAYSGGQNFPRLSLNPPIKTNCPNLYPHLIAQNPENRTVLFDCGGMPAFIPYAPLTMRSSPEGEIDALAKPIFTLPKGYLNLSITEEDWGSYRCPTGLHTSGDQTSSLYSGESYSIRGFSSIGYDYCAIISNSAGSIEGFQVKWVEGSLRDLAPDPNIHASLSASNITIQQGQNATTRIDVTSTYGWQGAINVTAAIGFLNSTTPGPPMTKFDATQARLPPNSSIHFTMTVLSDNTTTKGTWTIFVSVYNPDGTIGLTLTVRVT